MSSDIKFIEFVIGQIETDKQISFKKMFGEYAIYSNGKVVALVCDNQVFVKPTEKGRKFIEDPVEAPPYPGAKKCFLVEDKFEDRNWFSELIAITEKELPVPKPKIKKREKNDK
jgi:TfoX/Sxy family transcriptional regulator of competence genes